MTTIRVSSGVQSGGTYYATVSVYSSGSTLDVVIAGGIEIVSDGGISVSTYLKKGTSETVLHRGTSRDTAIDDRANLFVSAGGKAYSSKIYAGGTLLVQSGGISSKTNAVGGGEYIHSGGTAIDTKVDGGDQILFGGKSISTFLDGTKAPGYTPQFIYSGGTAYATDIGYGGTQYVGGPPVPLSKGKDIAYSTIDSGTEIVSIAGETSGTVILNGGYEYVNSGGYSYGTKVSNGTEAVSSSGVAVGTTVFKGGSEIVSSAGVTSRTTISGGKLEIEKGGIARGLITFAGSGGELAIDSKSMPTATIEGFAATDIIVLSAIPYSTSDSVSVNAANIVTISAGGKTYNLHIAGATVGETDFAFTSGSILTRGATDQPGFLRPAASAAPASNVWDEKVVMATATTAPASKSAGAVTSAPAMPAWQPVNALTIHQENIAQVVSSHKP